MLTPAVILRRGHMEDLPVEPKAVSMFVRGLGRVLTREFS